MPKRISTTVVLAVVQVMCLAFGLWMQDRFLIQAATWQDRSNDASGATVGGGTNAAQVSPQVSAESLLTNMPLTRVLTLAWTGGLQMVTLFLVITRLRTDHSKKHEQSKMELLRREKDLVRTRNAVIFGLASLAESRDRETGQHLERIALYSTRLASAMRTDPRFSHLVSATFVKSIGVSSALHDIGKVGVPDAILLKPGQLTDDERRQMQKHTLVGSACLEQIERRLGSSNFLHMARQIALHHHERWDGTGYPCQLQGEEIPLVARIVAIADIYDALSVRRVYKEAFPHDRCVDIIRQESGKHLDPAVVDVFMRIQDEFAEISRQFADSGHRDEDKATETPRRPRRNIDESELIETVLDFEKSIEKALVGAPIAAL